MLDFDNIIKLKKNKKKLYTFNKRACRARSPDNALQETSNSYAVVGGVMFLAASAMALEAAREASCWTDALNSGLIILWFLC